MKAGISLVILLLIGAIASAQRVANYSYGEPGKADYEEFSFWVKANKHAEINYTYGREWKTVNLKYLGKDILNGEECFKVKFSNKYELYIIPKGDQIKVSDLSGKYSKYFFWKYEGPVNGIGTFCEPCVENEEEAMKLVKLYYMK